MGTDWTGTGVYRWTEDTKMSYIKRVEAAHEAGKKIDPKDALKYLRRMLDSGTWCGVDAAVIETVVSQAERGKR